MATFLRCSRRGSPGGATSDLVSTDDSSAMIVSGNTVKAPEHRDLSSVSTDGSTTGGSTNVSDAESTAGSTELEAPSISKHGVLEVQPPMMPLPGLGNRSGESVKESCLNKCAPPFVPGAPPACLDYVSSVAKANCSLETEVHARLAHVISKLSPADAATVSAFLKIKLAKEKQAVQFAESCLNASHQMYSYQHDFCKPSSVPAPLGLRPPPGLCQEPPTQIEQLQQTLPSGLVIPLAHIGASKKQHGSEVEENRLRSNLNELAQFDPASIFLVRRINRLGLNSADSLKVYFAKFGVVKRVLANHSVEKPGPGRGKPRVRPAGLAFVVMDKPEEVTEILRFGSEHVVKDVTILASPYEQHERWNQGCSKD